ATAAKGINKLVEEGLLSKKRGIGMFVALGAPERLRQKRRQKFNDLYVQPLAAEAGKLGIGVDELLDMIKSAHLSNSSHGGMRDV
ncbi:MAG TPA: GntR family transcriptional regulator, partial [Micrococcaceae bacterium]|nr:GntR family transcriptional regulator [Micrococcaceae bacterium]